jgi:hypothetical protein
MLLILEWWAVPALRLLDQDYVVLQVEPIEPYKKPNRVSGAFRLKSLVWGDLLG